MPKIKLEENNIESLDKLKCFAGHKLKKINLEGNPIVTSNENYKKELFELIPSLVSIDGTDKNGEIIESTYYGGEEDEEEEFDEIEGEEFEDDEGEGGNDEGEDDEGDGEEDDDDEKKKNKKTKH